MNTTKTLTIRNQSDIIFARSEVRNLARIQGFSTADQARISLATSSLASALKLGETQHDQIIIGRLQDGVRVVCVKKEAAADNGRPKNMGDVGLMVDELTIKELPANGLQVTLIKWQTAR